MQVKMRLDVRTADGGHASAAYDIAAPNKTALYMAMTQHILVFAQQHNANPADVQQTTMWIGET